MDVSVLTIVLSTIQKANYISNMHTQGPGFTSQVLEVGISAPDWMRPWNSKLIPFASGPCVLPNWCITRRDTVPLGAAGDMWHAPCKAFAFLWLSLLSPLASMIFFRHSQLHAHCWWSSCPASSSPSQDTHLIKGPRFGSETDFCITWTYYAYPD